MTKIETIGHLLWEWTFDRLNGNNYSFTKYIDKIATLPIAVFPEQKEAALFLDYAVKQSQQLGKMGIESNLPGQVLGGILGRTIGSALMLTASSFYLLYKGKNRALGSFALLGNIVKKQVRNIEDYALGRNPTNITKESERCAVAVELMDIQKNS